MKRVRLTFWGLVLVAVLASGGLSTALSAPPGPVAGLAVAASGLVLAVAFLLVVRILFALTRAADTTPPGEPPTSRRHRR